MQAWYKQAHALLLGEALTPALLDSTAQASQVVLRPGFEEIYELTRVKGAPLIVCSAGLGNVVRALLKHRLCSAEAVASVDTLPIVSNWLQFDDAGRVCGFSEPLLHMFNKDGHFIRQQLGTDRWAGLAAERRVCVVLGDSLGDAAMADGLGMSVVKIGLLNETDAQKVADRLPQYEAAFDAVILGDVDFDWLLALFKGLA